jgi:hypothetical protein
MPFSAPTGANDAAWGALAKWSASAAKRPIAQIRTVLLLGGESGGGGEGFEVMGIWEATAL